MSDKEKILVVDDEPSIRKYLHTLLEVDGYDVSTVSSGKEALDHISSGERPDLIVLDVLMPGMDGLETLRQLMEINRGLNVIMLSCSNEVTTVVEAIRLGASDYLTSSGGSAMVCRVGADAARAALGRARTVAACDRSIDESADIALNLATPRAINQDARYQGVLSDESIGPKRAEDQDDQQASHDSDGDPACAVGWLPGLAIRGRTPG